MRRRSRALAAAVATLVLLASAQVTPVLAAPGAPPLPADDAFYTAPAPLPDLPPGTVIKSRPVTVTGYGFPIPAQSWQLMFVSRNAKGTPVEGIATVMVPTQSAPMDKRPLVSYQTAEDSLARHCAPSYTLRAGTEKELGLASLALAQGWAVVMTDYEGPQSQYGAGWQAGRATLDGIRAAVNFAPAGLGADTPVGMWGYSGGGLATAWANELEPTYAPELNIVGAAQGGVPPDLAAVARQIDGGPFSGIYFAVSVGLSRAYPEMRIDSILNDKGRAMATNHLGHHRPTTPTFDYHSINDELIPIAEVDELMAEYCADGVPLTYYRDPASEHTSLAVSGAPAAVGFLAARFAGQTAPTTC